MSKKTLQQLDELERFYQSHRWIQHNLSDMEGGYCILGACFEANVPELARELNRIIKGETLIQWNDSPSRTFDDVKQLIRDARRVSAH